MLTWDEEDFLRKIPKDKKVYIKPYNKLVSRTAQSLIKQVQKALPQLQVSHMGASALEISGQNDIDVYIFSKSDDFKKYVPTIEKLFGPSKNSKYDSSAWNFQKNGLDVELYLTDPTSEPMRRQIAIFKTLKKDSKLRKQYESLKEEFNGRSFREYQKRKYEFYHSILDK